MHKKAQEVIERNRCKIREKAQDFVLIRNKEEKKY